MFEGISIYPFDNDNPSEHPLNFTPGVVTTSAIMESLLKALDKGSQVSINVTKKHLIPSENNMPLKSYYGLLPKSDINDRNAKDSPHSIQQYNSQWRSNVFKAFCNELFLNIRLIMLVCSRMTDQ